MIPGRLRWNLESDASRRQKNTEIDQLYRTVPGHYRVQFEDEPVPNEVTLFRDEPPLTEETAHYGHCTCLDYHDGPGPCAHLWAVYNDDRGEIATFQDVLSRSRVCPVCGSVRGVTEP